MAITVDFFVWPATLEVMSESTAVNATTKVEVLYESAQTGERTNNPQVEPNETSDPLRARKRPYEHCAYHGDEARDDGDKGTTLGLVAEPEEEDDGNCEPGGCHAKEQRLRCSEPKASDEDGRKAR